MILSLALALALLVLAALSAFAAPTPSIGSERRPHHLPLARRTPGFKKLHGDDLVAWTDANTARLRSKYASKLKSSTRKVDTGGSKKRDTAGSASLVNYQHDSTFYAPVQIGTPSQTINLILDTGSSDIWAIQNHNNWTPASSSTFENSTTAFQISYGSGDVQGTLAQESITLAGHTSSSQTFAVATYVTSGLLDADVDGIMGFGFRDLSTSQATPFWQSSGASEFGFYLQPDTTTSFNAGNQVYGGEFTLGGTNTSLYQGDVNWSDVVDETYWLITLGGITIGGANISLSGTNKVAVDTGTTLIGAPTAVVDAIYAQIPGATALSSNNGYYQFPCSTTVNATMHFGDQEYLLSGEDVIAGAIDTQGVNCMGSFFSIGSDDDDELQYILGDTFLTKVYSIYDNTGSTARVGFASLADGLSVSTTSKTVTKVTASSGAVQGRAVSVWTVAIGVVGATAAMML